MDHELNLAVSRMDEYKMEAQVLVPVLQAARAELGLERAHRLILGAVRTWSQARFKAIGEGLEGSPSEKWRAIHALDMQRVREHDLELEITKEEPGAFEYTVTRCAYADFFRGIGESELGTILACESSFHIVEQVASPEVTISRSKTIMDGAPCCEICYRMQGGARAM